MKDALRLWSCPWDIQRWRSSLTRRRLSAEARGILRELFDECFTNGWLPDDQAECARIASVTPEEMSRNWSVLRPCFRLKGGKLRNAVADQMRVFCSKKYQKFRVAGALGGTERARRMRDLRSDASSDASSDAQASAFGSVSIPGFEEVEKKGKPPRLEAFPDPEVLASVQTRVPVTTRPVLAGNEAAALAEACKVQIWDQYPGVKTEDDFRTVLSLCGSSHKLAMMAMSLAGWLASGRWTDLRYVPRMHTWLCGDAKGHGPECWTIPPTIAPAKSYGSSEDEAMRQAAANLPKLGL